MLNDLKYTDEELLNMPVDERFQVFINNVLDFGLMDYERAKCVFELEYKILIQGETALSFIDWSFPDKVKEVYNRIIKRDLLK